MRKLLTKVVAVVLMLSMVFSTCVFAEFDPKAPLGPGINCVKTLFDGTTVEFFTLDRKDEIIARLEKEAKRNDARKFSEKQISICKAIGVVGGIGGVILGFLGGITQKKVGPAFWAYMSTMFLSEVAGFFMFLYPEHINIEVFHKTDCPGIGDRYLIRCINDSIKLIPYYADNEYRKQVEQGLAILRPPKGKLKSDPQIPLRPDVYTQYDAQNEIYKSNRFINLEKNKLATTVKE